MADFLSDEWFAHINETLELAVLAESLSLDASLEVVFHFRDAPANGPAAMTFSLAGGKASLVAGIVHEPDAVVTLTHQDARAMADGTMSGGVALREGRLKVRGDVNAVTTYGAWMVAAQSSNPGSQRAT